jgi:hypothetical protein
MDRELVETLRRVMRIIKNLKEPIYFCQFQDHCRPGRNRSQFQVAVSFHRFFHAVQEYLDACAVHLRNIGKIKHQAWAIRLQEFLNVLEKQVSASHHELCREFKHYHGLFGHHDFRLAFQELRIPDAHPENARRPLTSQ